MILRSAYVNDQDLQVIKRVKCPVRIDFGGGTTDVEPFASSEGGCVLSAAINKYVIGTSYKYLSRFRLEYESEVPTAGGLGTSAAMNLCWLALVTDETAPEKLAENAYRIEQARGERGGRQDQYASALGGINLMRFDQQGVHVEKMNLSEDFINALYARLVLVYTGEKELDKTKQDQEIMDRYRRNDERITSCLRNIKDTTYRMKSYPERGQLDKFGRLFNDEWANRKQLHPSKSNPKLDEVINRGLRNSVGAKVLGAAGGGCVLFYTKKPLKVKEDLKDYLIIEFEFDFEGIVIDTQRLRVGPGDDLRHR